MNLIEEIPWICYVGVIVFCFLFIYFIKRFFVGIGNVMKRKSGTK